jgi:hypothetical protein
MRVRAAIPGTALALVLASNAQAFTTGFQVNEALALNAGTRQLWLSRTVAAGAGIVRVPVEWPSIVGDTHTWPSIVGNTRVPVNPTDPADPAYDFSAIDRAVVDARAYGLNVLLTVNHAPPYAEGPNRPSWAKPGTWAPRPAALGDFMRALALRYSGRYAGLPAAQEVEVWNEPNQAFFLSPAFVNGKPWSPGHYRKMLNASYRAVKEVNPAMRVLAGGTAPYGGKSWGVWPVTFWRKVFCLDKRKCPPKARLDILGHHPISTNGGPDTSGSSKYDASTPDLDRIVTVLRAAERKRRVGRIRHPAWVTEFWWDSNPPNLAGFELLFQAWAIRRSLRLFYRDGASAAINFRLRDTYEPPFNVRAGFQSGVYFIDGTPKPSLLAPMPWILVEHDDRSVAVAGEVDGTPNSGTLAATVRANR